MRKTRSPYFQEFLTEGAKGGCKVGVDARRKVPDKAGLGDWIAKSEFLGDGAYHAARQAQTCVPHVQ